VGQWVTAVWVTAFVLNNFSMAASVLESGICVADGVVSCVLDSDVLVAAASVLESGFCVAVAIVSCVSESDVWVVVAARATT
jgi:hypothetical protein